MASKRRKAFEGSPVPIVTDGLQSSRNIGEGRWFPIIVVNSDGRPDLNELFARTKEKPPGDVNTQWARPVKFKHGVILSISFLRPIHCEFFLLFDLRTQGIIVDYIMDAEAFALQLGKPGQLTSDLLEEPRIVIEVPMTFSKREWEKMFTDAVLDALRMKGHTKREAREDAPKVIENMRLIREHRLKPL